MPSQSSPVSDFLRARRSLVQPEDIGLPRTPNRRVEGLRREEVASRAGISPEYYLRLEQGKDQQPSDQVVAALARALLLDADALDYLRRIARPRPLLRRTAPALPGVDANVTRLIDQWWDSPAFVVDRNQDVVAANLLARVLGGGALEVGRNLVLSTFSGPRQNRLPDWEHTAREAVAALRYYGDPADLRHQRIVGVLSANSGEFRRMWARYDVHAESSGTARSFVEPFGWVEFRWQSLVVPRSSGYVAKIMFGDPGSRAAEAIEHLAAGRDQSAPTPEPVLVDSGAPTGVHAGPPRFV